MGGADEGVGCLVVEILGGESDRSLGREGEKLLLIGEGRRVPGIDLQGGGDEGAGLFDGTDRGIGLRRGEPRRGLVGDGFPLVDDIDGRFMAPFGDEGLDEGEAQFPVAGIGGKRLGEFRDAHEVRV